MEIKNLPEVIFKDSDYLYHNKPVPRVTHILSKCIHSDELMNWANYLGYKHQNYREVLNLSATIGSQCHNSIDEFTGNGIEPEQDRMYPEAYCAFLSFNMWYSQLCANNKVKVIEHEKTLVCKYFGGTLDALYEINGKLYLIDYKTSNHVRYNYALQLAAYRYMIREIYNLEVNGVIILQLSKKSPGYNEYMLDFSNPDHLNFMNDCEAAFFALVYAYYNIAYIEEQYKNLIWKGDMNNESSTRSS
jgi:hypothetical protein